MFRGSARVGMVLGAVALAWPAGAVTDHLACFRVRDHAARGRFTVALTTDTGTIACTVKTPAKVGCLEMSQDLITPLPPTGAPGSGSKPGSFLCYTMKCPKPFPPGAPFADQFGSRTITFRGAQLLCAPATQTGATATTTSSTTTGGSTTSTTAAGCTFSEGRCTGTCGAGMRCGTSVPTGCTCQPVPCGEADAPECNGACSNAGEACVFDPTDPSGGCTCVTSSP